MTITRKTQLFPKHIELTVFDQPEILTRKKCLNWLEARYATADGTQVIVELRNINERLRILVKEILA